MSDTPQPESIPARRPRWWYSADEKRGFCWASVVGHDYRSSSGGEHGKSTLYLYLNGALMHLTGNEADSVYAELKKR